MTTPKEIADCFNNHSITVGPKLAEKCPKTSIKPESYLTETHNQFSFTFIKPLNVLKQLNKLDTGKATGVDNIPNKILKIAAPLIFEHLTVIFNKSIALNDFPTDFKVARVSPIFKSGEKNDPSNYRPISVLSCVARVFEKLIYEQLYSYLIVNNLLNPRQSGFRSLHSTVTALLDLTNDWCFNIDRGLVNGVMYLDLKKAFDTVDHALLITKLKFMGLRETTLNWFKSYLSTRPQTCFVNGVYSDKKTITCGVPQGSILGPLLFLIFINDLTTCLKFGRGRMYADDTNVSFSANNLIDLQREMSIDLA